MNKIIICGIPMKDRVDPSIYVSDDKSIPASSRSVRFPINAFLEETMKSDDSIKFLLLVKKDGYGNYKKNLDCFKEEFEAVNAEIGATADYVVIDTEFSEEKGKYESLIMNSPLFGIDKEQETTAYKRESYKMVEYLYCYLLAINERDYEPYGSEIMDVATRCINNFDSSKGVFLYYFNSAWKQEYSHIMGEKISDKRFHGIRITEEEKRNIRKYLKLAEKMDSCVSRSELFERISEAMNISVDKVELLAQMSSMFVASDTTINEDGEEINIWEHVSDGKTSPPLKSVIRFMTVHRLYL